MINFVVAMCSSPSDPPNGEVTYNGTSVGDNATYTCNPGFELVGDAVTTCMLGTDGSGDNASFDLPIPICHRKINHVSI